jgi:hypothetical protein
MQNDKNYVTNRKNIVSLFKLAPCFGCLGFIELYVIATLYYPGGSQLDKNITGFSWTQNYWCNLLNVNAINGQPNTARPIAIAAMFVLCISLIFFWHIFPSASNLKTGVKILIKTSGTVAMVTSLFLLTSFHDSVINLACFFGLIAIIGTIIGLRKLNWLTLFWMGIFIFLLVGINNLFYYGEGLLFYLPVIQKITFLYVLFWICLVNIRVYRMGVRNDH